MKTTNSKKMNQKWYSPGFIIPCVAGISLCVSSLSAQEESEEVYELSPFTISADDVDGYRATSTMAGTRLKSNLKDIGSSISVVTAQLFEDTGATDASTILSYTMGTEVSGANGNFSDGLGTNQNGRPTQDLQRLDPAQSQRVRGLASASLTRNFFLTDIPFDSYNTDRVEISRGANSILFGIGSPGGVINASTVLAHSDGEDFNEVSFRLGERGSHRETVDVHRVVVDGRLAVRLNLLNKDTRYKQAPAYEEDQRIYLTAEAVLFKNEGNEKIGPLRARASYENGNIEGNPPSILPPGDGFSSWWALPDASLLASVPGVKIPFYHPDAGTVDPSAVGAFEGSRIHPEFGINGWVPQQTFDTRIGFSPRKNLPAPAEQVGNWGSSVVFADPSGNTLPVVLGNGSRNGDWAQISSRLFQAASISFYGGNRNGQKIPNFTNPVILDKGVWDNTRSMIQGSTNFHEQDFETNNITLEQTFFNDKFGIELAYDQQDYSRFALLPFTHGQTGGDSGESDVMIDLSEYLVTGEPNPNVGRPFMNTRSGQGTRMRDYRETDKDAFRATTFLELDFTERSSWLGKHSFTGFFNSQKTAEHTWITGTYFDNAGNPEDIGSPTGSWWQRSGMIAYVGPSALNYNSPGELQLSRIDVPYIQAGQSYQANVFNSLRTDSEGNLDPGADQFTYQTVEVYNSALMRAQEIDTNAFIWQGRFLNSHIVPLVGWRKDEVDSFENITPTQGEELGFPQFLPGGGLSPDFARLQDAPTDSASADTLTKSIVVHVPESWTGSRFGLSFHASESENFDVSSTRRTPQGTVLEAPQGTTEEIGFTTRLFDNKLIAKFNWYETRSANDSVNIGDGSNAVRTIWQLNRVLNDAEHAGLSVEEMFEITRPGQAPLFSSYDDVYNEIISWVPSDIQAVRNFRVETINGVKQAVSDPNPGETAIRDYVSEGFELELTYNITDNWRMFANVAKQNAVQSGTARNFAAVGAQILPNIQNSELGNSSISPSFLQSFLVGYEGILSDLNRVTALDGTESLELREWRINAVTTYDFSEGALKGFSIGSGLRWQSESSIGYANTFIDGGGVVPDITKPFKGPSEFNGDIWLGYSRRLADKIDWKVQLNVRNAFGDDDYIPVVINPDGQVAVVRNPNPRAIFLTNTFKF